MPATKEKPPVPKVDLGPHDWEAWSQHLAERKTPVSPLELIPSGKKSPLRWELAQVADAESTKSLLKALESGGRKKRGTRLPVAALGELLEPWLAAADGRVVDVGLVLECLAWLYRLPQLASELPTAPWCQTFDFLLHLAEEATAGSQEQELLLQQLLCGELPLTLAYQFPEIEACTRLGEAARSTLAEGLLENVDGDGLIHHRHLTSVRPLLACWTRCGFLARTRHKHCFKGNANLHYDWFVRRALQLTRHDGSAVFAKESSKRSCDALFDAALMLAGNADDRTIANHVLPGRKKLGKKKSKRRDILPESAAQSEWAQVAILRPNWSRDSEQLTVAYGEGRVEIELSCGGDVICLGDWSPQVKIDGQPAELTSDWEQVCWSSDDDVDYLELEIEINKHWRLGRQLLMSREDHFLFAADALVGEGPAELQYQCDLPLGTTVGFYPADETREGMLVTAGQRLMVFPLAFPEWRNSPSLGELAFTGSGCSLRQQTTAAAMYMPLFFDLSSHRSHLPFTWRKLTVAQKLQILPDEAAVGYRIRCGGEQWLFYRSLTAPANRTVLGQNLSSEFYAARFDFDGEAEELISIEPN